MTLRGQDPNAERGRERKREREREAGGGGGCVGERGQP